MTRILVVGDAMLDVVCRGVVERLSPEAPVPVLKNPVEDHHLGGAANTAANVRGLGATVTLLSSVGDDADGRRLTALLDTVGVDAHLETSCTRTTRKTRFLADSHHLLRVDHEVPHPSTAEFDNSPQILALLHDCDVLLISDYCKGFVRPAMAHTLITRAVDQGKPTVVDTKATRLDTFRGATVLTPNLSEARAATGEEDPLKAAHVIRNLVGSHVLLTLGARGMLALTDTGPTSIPSHALEVSDVTGAGDTVAAAVAVALASGQSLVEAAEFASRAAAVAVGHAGTYTVSLEDLVVDGSRGGR